MKYLIIFALGVIIGAVGLRWYDRRPVDPADADASAGTASAALERARAGARDVGDRISDQLRDWNLSGDDIRRELASSGRVIRNQARVAGARIDDARIVALIKAKYVLDDGLAASEIKVDCRDGHVRLSGQVASDEAIGRAVALALETQGVVEVNAELTASS